MKNIRPLYSTIVDPSEYEVDEQMEAWLKDANDNKACSHGIDVGKLWGLYQSWKGQQRKLEAAEKIIWIINNEPHLYDTIRNLADKYKKGSLDSIIGLKR